MSASALSLGVDEPYVLTPNAPIGIFDSGLGGLSVLRQLRRQLPQESVLYLADTARLPYGSRSAAQIVQFVGEALAWMRAQQVKLVLIACNTGAALTLDTLSASADLLLLDPIRPGAEAAVAQSSRRGGRIGVLATRLTVASDAYRRTMQTLSATVQVWQISCPDLVPLIEQSRLHEPQIRSVLQGYLTPLLAQGIDTLVHGCTHYPLLEPVLRSLLPAHLGVVDPAIHLVAAAGQKLAALSLHQTQPGGATRFCVTGDPNQFSQRAAPWLGYCPEVVQVGLGAA